MNKGQISNLLRQCGLLNFTDWIRYYLQKFKNRSVNRKFKKNNPDVVLPPDYLIYESFQLNYSKYYTESIGTAQWLVDYFSKHIELKTKKYWIGVVVRVGWFVTCLPLLVMSVNTMERITTIKRSIGVQNLFPGLFSIAIYWKQNCHILIIFST